MKAQELRIGNWVRYSGNWCYRKCPTDTMFQWDTSDWYALGECTLSLDEIEPIPITENILLKAGFEWDNDHNQYTLCLRPGLWGFLLVCKYDFSFSISYLKGSDEAPGGRLNGVHQLQNIYFSLTGEELTIDL